MPMAAMSASEQLARLLYILPAAAREDGVTLGELARALGTDEATVVRDLEEATARVWYQPAGAVDPFTILIEDERVYVITPAEFARPTRLTQGESLALSLGLRTLAAESDGQRRDHILALAARLERELVTPELQLRPATGLGEAFGEYEPTEMEIALGEDDVRGLLADAIADRHVCTIDYLKPSEPAASARRIAPHSLIYANGLWYVAAEDLGAASMRLYRLDRITSARVQDEVYQSAAPTEQSAERIAQRGFPYLADEEGETEVVVRYSPRVSRWVAERMPAEVAADGSARMVHSVADQGWLVRHVLQYGGEAVVERGALRRAVAEAAARLSA